MLHNPVYRQFLASFFASLSVFCAGCSFVWITPLLVRLQEEGAEVPLTHATASWVVSLIELGNFVSPIPVAFLGDRVGRKPVLLATAPMYILTWLLVLFTRSVEMLYIMRFIQGIALGIVYTVLPLYIGEVAEPKLRGTLSILFIAIWFLGILLVYCAGPFVSYQTLTWICFVPPVIFLFTFWYFPESPYFLLLRGKEEKAGLALAWLRGENSVDGVREELQGITDSIQEEAKLKANWKDVFKTKVGRKSLLLAQIVAMTEIMAGFTPVLTYATDTINLLGYSLMDPDTCTIIIGVVTLVVTVVAGGLVDKAGRRPILLVSSVGSLVTLAASALYFYLHERTPLDLSSFHWVPYVTLMAFMAVMNMGLAALLPTLQAELFPTATRGFASGITALNICILSFLVLRIYFPIQDAFGLYVNYVIYSGFAALGTILIYFMLPETKGKTFTEIQELLS